jgi:hypothetical protein
MIQIGSGLLYCRLGSEPFCCSEYGQFADDHLITAQTTMRSMMIVGLSVNDRSGRQKLRVRLEKFEQVKTIIQKLFRAARPSFQFVALYSQNSHRPLKRVGFLSRRFFTSLSKTARSCAETLPGRVPMLAVQTLRFFIF